MATRSIRFERAAARVLAATAVIVAGSAAAFTYVRPADETLWQRADLVVQGRIGHAGPDPGNPLGATLYRVLAQRAFKGPPGDVAFTLPGAHDPAADDALVVPGMPRFAPGDQVLLFLRARPDGQWRPVGEALGSFAVIEARDGAWLRRDLSAGEALGGAHEGQEEVRDLERFSAWLEARALARPGNTAYWRARPAASAKYSLQGSPGARWFEFQEQRSVPLYASQAGQTGLLGGGYPEFQAALRAWNDDAASTVRYAYAGTTAASGGLERADGVNAIQFNDPASDLAGVFDCLHGGVVAYAGWRSRGSREFAGRTFQPIVEVDIVVQNGAGCVLSRGGNTTAAEVFAHELGHTLGVGHSCSDDGLPACQAGTSADQALMRPYLHGDGRGAALGADDRNAAAFLYPGAGGVVPPPPPAGVGGNPAASEEGGGGGGAPGRLALVLLWLSAIASARARSRT